MDFLFSSDNLYSVLFIHFSGKVFLLDSGPVQLWLLFSFFHSKMAFVCFPQATTDLQSGCRQGVQLLCAWWRLRVPEEEPLPGDSPRLRQRGGPLRQVRVWSQEDRQLLFTFQGCQSESLHSVAITCIGINLVTSFTVLFFGMETYKTSLNWKSRSDVTE